MKVRWNACYALGNAFRNPALPLGKSLFTEYSLLLALGFYLHTYQFVSVLSLISDSASWSCDAFSALCHVVISCKNFKVRIKSAAALAVPAHRRCYGDTKRFSCVWHSLATALENSEDTNDFLEYRYSASLRHTLSQALLHLLSISQFQDLPALGASLVSDEGRSIKEHLIKYLRMDEGVREGVEGEKDTDGFNPEQRIEGLQQTLIRLKGLKAVGGKEEEEERDKDVVLNFLEDLIKTCEEP